TRRSVRNFTDSIITDNELREILEAARVAQSWSNTQVWEFIVVRDKEMIKQVTDTYGPKNPATACSLNASALIVACAKTGVSGCYKGKDVTALSNWFMFDMGIAVQNLCLKIHDMGLGTVVVGYMDHEACSKIVGLPQDFTVVAVLPIGNPSGEGIRDMPRKALKDCVHLNRFGNPF
ncbi:MAG: nitroreductase family protein, partial [Desulfomonilia bacterium]|nr:nitroreductase family protein [Desulfomonilia bacterium]